MMRGLLNTVVLLSAIGATAPASALQADDTMAAWKRSSEGERAELLGRLLGGRGAPDGRLLACMDETAEAPGHSGLSIRDVAKACESDRGAGQPV